jgi:hypothetical protein
MEKIAAKLGAVLYVCWGLLHFTAAYGVLKLAQNFPGGYGAGPLDADGILFGSFRRGGDHFRDHVELAQQPVWFLGQRRNGRHC